MRHSEYTLRSIHADMDIEAYSWACFKAQQAAEFALKALLRALGRPAFGRNLVALFDELSRLCPSAEGELRFCIGYLDKMYVTPGCPDALTEEASYERYTKEEATKALDKPWWREALRHRVVLADDYSLFGDRP